MPPLAVCAVTDDEHVGDIVAAARWLETARAFTPRYLHVTNGLAGAAVPHMLEPSLTDVSLAALVPGCAVEVVTGPIAAELERRAEQLGAALLVVGSRRRGPVGAALAGSVSRMLLTRGTRPVLVPRQDRDEQDRGGPVVCGVTRPLAQAQKVARAAAGLARRLDRPLVVAMVVDAPLGGLRQLAADVQCAESYLDGLARWLDVPAGVSISVPVGSPPAALAAIAEETAAALVVVGCRGHGALGAMIAGSVSRTLIRKAAWPLVVVPLRHRP